MITRSTSAVGFSIAILYGTCSASMTFINKLVLTYLDFNFPFFIVSCQMAFTVVVLEVLRLSGNSFIVEFTPERAWRFLVPSLFYAANSVLSLSALNGMNIPMYGVIKRCAPVVILILGIIILKKPPPSASICLSVTMITCGCFLAGYGDLTFDPRAYAYGMASVLSQALYLLLVQKHASDFGAAEALHLNSINTLPLLIGACLLTQEARPATEKFVQHLVAADSKFIASFASIIIFGCLLNYLLFLCTTYNSALTTSITGTLKTLIQTAVGMFTFGGVTPNVYLVTGIALNFSGGFYYTLVKHRSSLAEKPVATKVSKEVEGEVKIPICNGMAEEFKFRGHS